MIEDKKYQVTEAAYMSGSVSVRVRELLMPDNIEDIPEETVFSISVEDYENMEVSEGDVINSRVYSELEVLSGVRSAYKRGIGILAASDYSQSALVRKLTLLGFDKECSIAAVDILCDKGYINEKRQTKRLAYAYAQRKLWGKKRIAADLMSKGYSSSLVKSAVGCVPEEIYRDGLSRLIDKKCSSIPSGRELDKLVASLSRMGYSIGEIMLEIDKRK